MSVPEDMIAEILSLLPAESLLRFKCVCKKWRQLIQQVDFVEKHHTRAAMCFYINQPMKNMGRERIQFTSCNDIKKGLLLEHEYECEPGKETTERLRIRNPATRQTVYLPDLRVGNEPAGAWVVARMFFVAKSNNECTVISFSGSEESVFLGRFRAVTVGVDEAWRPLKNSPPNSIHCISNSGRRPKINALSIENVFYIVTIDDKKILWVDAEDESIKTAKIPENLFLDWSRVMPREWNSKLSLFYGGDQINIWVLMNNSRNEWAKTQAVHVATCTLDCRIPFITNGKRYGVPWHNMKEALSVKPTVLQLKGMQFEEEAIGARFWKKERDMPKNTWRFISVISLLRL